MRFIREFSELGRQDTAIAGGKGASLGEMTKAGIPVPPGFVILANAFDEFLEMAKIRDKIQALLSKIDHNKTGQVEKVSRRIQAVISGPQIPEAIATETRMAFKQLKTKYVAVRSSATAEDSKKAAWAGQLQSFLYTTEATLPCNVKKCWASLYSPRAIFYRFEKMLEKKKISVAVVVQKMINSEVAGVAFSVHPVTKDRNTMIIEAGFGLGEAVVSGQITPDSYVVDKKKLTIIDKTVSRQERQLVRASKGGAVWKKADHPEKTKLTEKQIIQLARLVIKIEKHYGFAVDIEWAIEKGKIYITQSRPITTL
ncbi:MAG: PEP/pyruvate-binding domain-containing protein [Candidatus Woesearchaeota archaeon]